MRPLLAVISIPLLLAVIGMAAQSGVKSRTGTPQLQSRPPARAESRPEPSQRDALGQASGETPSRLIEPRQPPSHADVLDAASKAITVAQGQMTLVQTGAALLAGLLLVTGAINLTLLKRHASQISSLKQDAEAVAHAKAKLESELSDIRAAEGNAQTILKKLREHAEVVRAIHELALQKGTARIRPMQKLGQLVDPLGVAPMIAVLGEGSESPALRKHAAYGLGRYSALPDTESVWEDILECFRGVLRCPQTPPEVIQEVGNSVPKFGSRADDIQALFRDLWLSRHEDAPPNLPTAPGGVPAATPAANSDSPLTVEVLGVRPANPEGD